MRPRFTGLFVTLKIWKHPIFSDLQALISAKAGFLKLQCAQGSCEIFSKCRFWFSRPGQGPENLPLYRVQQKDNRVKHQMGNYKNYTQSEKGRSSPWHQRAGLVLLARPHCSPVEHKQLHKIATSDKATLQLGWIKAKTKPLHTYVRRNFWTLSKSQKYEWLLDCLPPFSFPIFLSSFLSPSPHPASIITSSLTLLLPSHKNPCDYISRLISG